MGNLCRNRIYLWVEFILLFLGVPYANMREWIPVRELWVLIALGVVLTLVIWFDRDFDRRKLIVCPKVFWPQIRSIFKVFVFFVAPSLTLLMAVLNGGLLFQWPQKNTSEWLWLTLYYPILSAYPQELIYRVFLFHRYAPILPTVLRRVITSAIVFAFYHWRYHHWIPIVTTLVGGFIIALRFAKTESGILASIEHALYGLWLFTVGLGHYFNEE